MGIQNKINGGYYIKARCWLESDIAHAPPHVREIWDWLISQANHKDQKKGGVVYRRGQVITTYKDIQEALHWMVGWRKMTYKKHDCENAMKWLKKATMVTTRKTTRGLIINIINYDKYQNPENYESHTYNQMNATMQPQSTDTINKNEKNEKNEILSPTGDRPRKNKNKKIKETPTEPTPINYEQKQTSMFNSTDRRMPIIAYYWYAKGWSFDNEQAYNAALKRELKPAQLLVGYTNEKIKKTIEWLKQNADFKWTLESVHKHIDEDLTKLASNTKTKTEDDFIQDLKKKYESNIH